MDEQTKHPFRLQHLELQYQTLKVEPQRADIPVTEVEEVSKLRM